MNAKQLFNKTMPFCMAKLVLGAIHVGICLVLFAILMGIGWLFEGFGLVVCFLIWLAAIKGVNLVVMRYGGYMVKAGHIAVIAESMKTGQIPENQVEYGKNLVKERFVTSNVYFAVDELVNGAIKEIQRGIEKVGNFLDFIPGMDSLEGLAKFFVQLSLGYVDECCIGWTFYNKDQNEFKSAADGVVIYAQNWKSVLKTAAKTMLKVVVGMIALVLVIFAVIGIIFKIFHWNAFIAFCIACLLAWLVKFAFVDSFMMCQSMGNYMAMAPATVITFDLYGKLCGMSKKFKELFDKAKEDVSQAMSETPAAEAAAAQSMAQPAQQEVQPQPVAQPVQQAEPQRAAEPQEAKPVFCGQCGTKNDAGAAFCGNCGAKLVK